jgi:hypothetical protein
MIHAHGAVTLIPNEIKSHLQQPFSGVARSGMARFFQEEAKYGN